MPRFCHLSTLSFRPTRKTHICQVVWKQFPQFQAQEMVSQKL